MTFSSDEVDVMASVLQAQTESFAALVRIAKLDPAQDLRGADLRGINFRTDDLSGFDFSYGDLIGADFSRARGLHPSMFFGILHDASTKWPFGFKSILTLYDATTKNPADGSDGYALLSGDERETISRRPMSKFERLWNECEQKVMTYARHLGSRAHYQAGRLGRSVEELEANSLVHWAWQRLLEHRPDSIATSEDLARYFIWLIKGRVSNLSRQPANSRSMLSIVSETASSEDLPGTIHIEELGQVLDSPEDELTTQDFKEYVGRLDSKVLPILNLMLHGEIEANLLAEKLAISMQQVFLLKGKLKQLLADYSQIGLSNEWASTRSKRKRP